MARTLEGKAALVTGGSRGIGGAIVERSLPTARRWSSIMRATRRKHRNS